MSPDSASRGDEPADKLLVEASRKGDSEAFEQLFRRHNDRAYRLAYNLLGNREDALDMVQEAFIKAYRKLDSFRGDSSFYTWFSHIVVNTSLDFRRARRPSRPLEYVNQDDEDAEPALPQEREPDPSKAAQDSELRERVMAAIDTLPPYHKSVIVLYIIEEMQYKEIAQALDCSIGTVMSRLHYARKKLQDILADQSE